MKRLLFILLMLPILGNAQTLVSHRTVAIPSAMMDTLYVIHDMHVTFQKVWDDYDGTDIKPTIVSLDSLLEMLQTKERVRNEIHDLEIKRLKREQFKKAWKKRHELYLKAFEIF